MLVWLLSIFIDFIDWSGRRECERKWIAIYHVGYYITEITKQLAPLICLFISILNNAIATEKSQMDATKEPLVLLNSTQANITKLAPIHSSLLQHFSICRESGKYNFFGEPYRIRNLLQTL